MAPNFNMLRPYQQEDARFLSTLSSGGCFNQQRTGKSLTALAACALKECQRILIVCPHIAVYHWKHEVETFYQQPCLVAEGKLQTRHKIIKSFDEARALVISYDALKQTSSARGVVHELLAQRPDAIIVDEIHKIQDRKSANAQAIFKFKNVPFKLGLTGTLKKGKPAGEWSICHFLWPKNFPSYWSYVEKHYTYYLQMNNRTGHRYYDVQSMKPQSKVKFQEFLNSRATNTRRKDVMKWIPEKEYKTVKLPITIEQQRYISELKELYETEHVVAENNLVRMIRYRQILLAPKLLDLKGSSPKIDWIKEYIQEYPDVPTILFSKFTKFIMLLKQEIPEIEVLVGGMSSSDLAERIDAFQTGRIKFLAINIDAGKEAITLDTAEACIFTDQFPPAGDIEQAEDRFVATTKERANKDHIIYKLMMDKTYDETLYHMVRQQAKEIDVINNFKKYMEEK